MLIWPTRTCWRQGHSRAKTTKLRGLIRQEISSFSSLGHALARWLISLSISEDGIKKRKSNSVIS
ncbi:hypothetical protein GLOTRDRAFT_111745 [Gloeophyllum trabeum ATCC 11539]|uniref:Uncharacterized protein n=1 Tax=Gloeophyllum trabeum (strain ATCC 11539 / FP-39264 / Madison 617) TaxID=670483 RepID=S7Q2A3_GLOTA|nr:uncharacterized protein GLOTRDRAFT_111745 [Gloeophyllum trabeum ATCC 11539]EPQ53677.1 hypothetical protein GLOTRDRAFT_111745 [Gloeophyllum trabeum ATCC 11539]